MSFPSPRAVEIGGDAPKYFRQIRPGAAAWVEHVDVLRRQPVGDAEIVPQRLVHTRHHVAHDFRWRVPNAELLPQVGIERFEERFVEVRHRLALVEAGEEGGAIHPVKRCCGPVQHLGQAKWLQVARIGDLPKQRPEHGCAEIPVGFAPAELSGVGIAGEERSRSGFCAVSTRPQHPSGEDAVEQRLHQRRAEEPQAPFALKPDPERLLQRQAHRGQLRRAARRVGAGEAVSRVRGEQPRQILRLSQRRSVQQRPCEILAKGGARIAGKRAGVLQPGEELVLASGQPQGLERRGLAVCVLAYQHEVAGVRHRAPAGSDPSSGWPDGPPP